MAAKETFCYWVGLDVGKQEFSAAIDLSMDDLKLDVLRLPCKTYAVRPVGCHASSFEVASLGFLAGR